MTKNHAVEIWDADGFIGSHLIISMGVALQI